jgi:hypothetical protein
MRKASIITLAVLTILFFVGLFYFYKLGGFNETEIKVINVPESKMLGKQYKGQMGAKGYGRLFEESEELLKKGKVKGDIAALFFNNPKKGTDTADVFIGIILKDSLHNIPEGFSLRKIPGRKVLQAHIQADILIAPFVFPDLEEYAKENNIVLKQNLTLEIYPGRDDMYIQIPVE